MSLVFTFGCFTRLLILDYDPGRTIFNICNIQVRDLQAYFEWFFLRVDYLTNCQSFALVLLNILAVVKTCFHF